MSVFMRLMCVCVCVGVWIVNIITICRWTLIATIDNRPQQSQSIVTDFNWWMLEKYIVCSTVENMPTSITEERENEIYTCRMKATIRLIWCTKTITKNFLYIHIQKPQLLWKRTKFDFAFYKIFFWRLTFKVVIANVYIVICSTSLQLFRFNKTVIGVLNLCIVRKWFWCVHLFQVCSTRI